MLCSKIHRQNSFSLILFSYNILPSSFVVANPSRVSHCPCAECINRIKRKITKPRKIKKTREMRNNTFSLITIHYLARDKKDKADRDNFGDSK